MELRLCGRPGCGTNGRLAVLRRGSAGIAVIGCVYLPTYLREARVRELSEMCVWRMLFVCPTILHMVSADTHAGRGDVPDPAPPWPRPRHGPSHPIPSHVPIAHGRPTWPAPAASNVTAQGCSNAKKVGNARAGPRRLGRNLAAPAKLSREGSSWTGGACGTSSAAVISPPPFRPISLVPTAWPPLRRSVPAWCKCTAMAAASLSSSSQPLATFWDALDVVRSHSVLDLRPPTHKPQPHHIHSV
jgi:hypothetical protein